MPRTFPIMTLLALALAGCSPLNRSVSEAELVKANRHVLIEGVDAPKVDGPRGCGAQALAAAIACADPAHPSVEVAAQLPWQDVGATPVDLLLEARRRGFDAVIERGTIERLTDLTSQQQPALVMIDAGPKVRGLIFALLGLPPKLMHWGIVSGMARDGSQVLLAATDHRHYIASRKDFLKRWEESDCCMIVVRSRETADAGNSGRAWAAGPLSGVAAIR